MIKLSIQGFQSLKDIELEIEGFTVIVGSNDVGKSAIIRAFKAFIEDWRGDSFIHDECAYCLINIYIGENYFQWYKQRKKSGVYGYNGTTTTKEFVVRSLKLGEIQLTKGFSVLPNIQDQLAPPFLLSSSDTIKSKVLSELTNASLLFLANSKFKQQATDNNNTLSYVGSQLSETAEALVKYFSLSEAEALLEECASLISKTDKDETQLLWMEERLSRLKSQECEVSELAEKLNCYIEITRSLVESYYAVFDEIHLVRWLIEYLPTVKTSIVLINKLKKLSDYLDSVSMYYSSLDVSAKEIEQLKLFCYYQRLIEKSLIDNQVVLGCYEAFCEIPSTANIEVQIDSLNKLIGYQEVIHDCKLDTDVNTSRLNEQIKTFEAFEDKMKRIMELLDVCPVCARPMEQEHAHIAGR